MWCLLLLCTSCSPFVPGTECVSRTPSSAAVTETGAVPSPPCFQWWYRPTRLCAGATKQRSDYEPYQPWGMACKWAHHYRFRCYSELLMSFYFLISSASGPQTNCFTKRGLKILVICLSSVVWMLRSLNDKVVFLLCIAKANSFASTEALALWRTFLCLVWDVIFAALNIKWLRQAWEKQQRQQALSLKPGTYWQLLKSWLMTTNVTV